MEIILTVIIGFIMYKWAKHYTDKKNKEIDEDPDAPGNKSFMGPLW